MESRLLEPHRAQRHAIEVHKHLLLCVCVCVCLCMVCVRCNFSKYMIFKYMYVELGSAGASKGQIPAPDAAGDATALGPLIHFFFAICWGFSFQFVALCLPVPRVLLKMHLTHFVIARKFEMSWRLSTSIQPCGFHMTWHTRRAK